MEITEIKGHFDNDWFAVDDAGQVAHFVTDGGNLIPDSAKATGASTEALRAYLLTLPTRCDAAASPALGIAFKDDFERRHYLEPFLAVARRGLYSYDAAHRIPRDFRGYELIALPSRPLNKRELPAEVLAYLDATVIRVSSFAKAPKVLADYAR